MSVHRLSSTANPQQAHTPKRDSKKERGAAETISRLQRGILRMSLSHHGENAELDGHLKELGSLLRSGRRDERLQDLIDEIVENVIALDGGQKPGQADSDAMQNLDSTPLVHFLDHLTTPADIQKEIDGFRALITAKQQTADTITQAEKAARAISAELESKTDEHDVIAHTRDALVELIERMPISDACSSEAATVKHSILSVTARDEFKPCIGDLAELIRHMRDEMQHEIDNLSQFLRSTAYRLHDFESVMNRSRDLHTDASNDALQLSETLCGEFELMRQDVFVAEDLDGLKSAIDSKLEHINDGLGTFVDAQQQRASEASNTIDSMVTKLKDLEDEAENLREDLEQTQARVLVDPLTGVLNRSGYIETIAKHFARWRRYGGALSLAVIDLDLFKKINDNYGHAAGDKVLSTVAANLGDRIRASDILCRYGGEEFVLILPETTGDDALVLVNDLRTHVESCGFRYKDTPVPVTLSGGVAQFHRSDSIDNVFERADQAMYQAKRNGRNQICCEAELESNAN